MAPVGLRRSDTHPSACPARDNRRPTARWCRQPQLRIRWEGPRGVRVLADIERWIQRNKRGRPEQCVKRTDDNQRRRRFASRHSSFDWDVSGSRSADPAAVSAAATARAKWEPDRFPSFAVRCCVAATTRLEPIGPRPIRRTRRRTFRHLTKVNAHESAAHCSSGCARVR
jgi:hypothetical protein